ncbi:MAG: serine/threonine-protein kinase [Deltaproteobacteria bacterium]|nr:serine/threonine-protein kinase [Deltaproteobacteria bacterium]
MPIDLEDLFHQALLLPVERRQEFLRQQSGIDAEEHRRLEALLSASCETESFLEHPAVHHGNVSAGSRLGPYLLEEVIGEGGMATVYRCRREDGEFDHQAAIKILPRGLVPTDLIRRFRRERQILAGLNHPGIARLLDGGSAYDGTPFLVLELVEGEPIDVFCDRRELSNSARLKLFLRVCEAVSHAHRSLVIHRDLKPANILVGEDGAPKLIDFGISKILDPAPEEALAPNSPAGLTLPFLTPAWASPEQLRGKAITTASDIYSLGRVLAYLLSGQAPNPHLPGKPWESFMAVPWELAPKDGLEAAAKLRNTSPRLLHGELRGDLRAICFKALRLDALARYPSVDALAEDVSAFLEKRPVNARSGSTRYRVSKFLRRHRVATAASAVTLLLLSSAVAAAIRQGQGALEQQRIAELNRLRTTQVNTFLTEMFSSADPNTTTYGITAAEMLEQASERQRRSFPDQPELRWDLALTLGDIYRKLGDFDRALMFFEDVAKDLESQPRSDPAFLTRSLLGLAAVQQSKRQLPAAQASAQTAWDIAREHLSPSAPLVIESALALCNAYLSQARPEEANELAIQAASRLPGATGPYEVLAGRLLQVQAFAAELRGRRRLAYSLMQRSLPLFRHSLGTEHPETLGMRHNFAVGLQNLGQFQKAEELHQEILKARLRRLGDNHPAVASTLQLLAFTAEQRQDWATAENLHRRALKIRQQVFNPDHPAIFNSQLGLAKLAWRQGDLEAAEVSTRQVLHGLSRSLPASHPMNGWSRLILGGVLTDVGKLKEAEGYLLEATAIFRRLTTVDVDPRVASAHCHLALCLHRQGRKSEAQRLARGACRYLYNSGPVAGNAGRQAGRTLRELGLSQQWRVEGRTLPSEAEGKFGATKLGNSLLEKSI